MSTAALVIIKPDGISKKLIGNIISKFEQLDLEVVAMKVEKTSRELVEEHYQHIKGQPFFQGAVDYFLGKFHNEKRLIAMIFYGKDAVKKCRAIAGATNPEKAAPQSVRGSYGRITTKGIYENVVHVSSDLQEAQREIKLWFNPDDIIVDLYPVKSFNIDDKKIRMWK